MKRFNNILYVLNTEKIDKSVLERVVTLAQNNQARLTVVSTLEPVTVGFGMPEGGPISVDLQAAMISAQTQKVETSVAPYQERVNIQTKLRVGTQFLEIIREVLDNGRDLVIKVPESMDWIDQLFGSEDLHLLRKCPCPVWLIKPAPQETYRRILAAVDVDDTHASEEQEIRDELNQQILELASSMALSGFAELHIVHAWEASGENILRGGLIYLPEERVTAFIEDERQKREAGLNRLIRKVNNKPGQDSFSYLKPQTHLIKGQPRKEIPALAKQIEADLIVMGTVARTGVPGFIIGNTAEAILGQIECSVLALKPRGFVSPVTVDK
ncbi:MAG: universal stress protein [Lysobacterales bacterium]